MAAGLCARRFWRRDPRVLPPAHTEKQNPCHRRFSAPGPGIGRVAAPPSPAGPPGAPPRGEPVLLDLIYVAHGRKVYIPRAIVARLPI